LYWEVDICGPKSANESVFERLDCMLHGIDVVSGIDAVIVWLNKLEANILWLTVSFDDFC
jgi:hypothetical protein